MKMRRSMMLSSRRKEQGDKKKVLLADDVVKACEKGSHKPMTIICKCDQAPGRRTPREKQGVANRCQGNRDCLAPSNHMTIPHACKT